MVLTAAVALTVALTAAVGVALTAAVGVAIGAGVVVVVGFDGVSIIEYLVNKNSSFLNASLVCYCCWLERTPR